MTASHPKKKFEEKSYTFSDIKIALDKIMTNFAKTLEELRECAESKAVENQSTDEVAKDKLIKLNKFLYQFSKIFEYYRQIKDEIEEKHQRGLSESIQHLQEVIQKTIQYMAALKNVYKGSHLNNSTYFENRLKEINEKWEFYRKAALPYEPPKLTL